MSQLAVILDNLVKISKNFNGSGRKQAPTGKQQQVFHEQHRNASFTTKSISPLRPQRERGVKIKKLKINESDLLPRFTCLALISNYLVSRPAPHSRSFALIRGQCFLVQSLLGDLRVLCGSNFFISTAPWFQPLP
ncbi:hypothetical protein AYO50_01365 [Acidobacteria bacterium SCGC AG-212-P17]|nr:hypothetical protein AYO50_01365 [Acidobacteria bacterium SCGC AG-212-P17]